MKNNLLVLAGAIGGGVLGHLGSILMAKWGFYALIMPGAVAGLGAGLFRCKSVWVAVACGFIALLAGLYTEWHGYPFVADESLGYFLTHLHQLRPVTMILIGVGTVIGFWVPFRRR